MLIEIFFKSIAYTTNIDFNLNNINCNYYEILKNIQTNKMKNVPIRSSLSYLDYCRGEVTKVIDVRSEEDKFEEWLKFLDTVDFRLIEDMRNNRLNKNLKEEEDKFEEWLKFLDTVDFRLIEDMRKNRLNNNLKEDLLTTLNSTDNNIYYNNDQLAVYTFSVPNMKLYYPEPFIASGNFSHNDLWFIHISLYQYWLWFFFIFLIIFFLIMFIVTLRWGSVRNKPSRETRGVSRSKCGDLITASVPITWAGSIIIHESTDAVDFYDGFGTSEMAVGVRAYQWGWEYYYPKDIDVMYYTSNFNNEFVGRSLFYTKENEDFDQKINYIEHHKMKSNQDTPITPAHLICFSTGFDDTLNLISSKNFGYSKLIKDNVYKSALSTRYINYNLNLNYIPYNNLFYKNTTFHKFLNMDIKVLTTPQLHTKQHEYLSLADLYNLHSSFYDMKSFIKYQQLNIQTKAEKLLNSRINSLNRNYNIIYTFLSNNLKEIKLDTDNLYLKEFYRTIYLNKECRFTKSEFKNTSDKYFTNFLLKKNDIIEINNTILNSKQLDLDLEYSNNFNILKIVQNDNYLNNKFSKITFKSIFNNLEFNFDDTSIFQNFKNNSIIYSKTKTPFKDSFMHFILLNNFNNNFNLQTSIDSQGGDFYFSNFILKFFTNSKKTDMFNNQVNNICNLANLSLFMYNVYGDSEDKRIPVYETYEDLVFSNMDDDSCVDFEYWINSSIDIKFFNDVKEKEVETSLGLIRNEKMFDKNKDNDLQIETLLTYELIQKLNLLNLDYIYFNNTSDNYYLNKLHHFNIFNNSIPQQNNTLNLVYVPNINFNYITNYKYINSQITNSFNNFKELTLSYSLLNINTFSLMNNFKFINEPQTILSNYWSNNEVNLLFTTGYKNLNKYENSFIKFTFDYSLVDSIKSLFQVETAVWRFYKNTFDLNKSFIDFDNFSNSFSKLPFINTYTSDFKKYINKNYISFVKSNMYIPKHNYLVNTTNNLSLASNIFMYSFPFSISTESDVLKYVWFDWYSNYNKRVAKQLDLSDYTINGVKIYKHKYDFSYNDVSKYNIKDNFLSRLSNSRKNYLPVWNYIPFIAEMDKNWTKDYILFNNISSFGSNMYYNNNISKFYFWLVFMTWFDELFININNIYKSNMTLSNSGFSTPSRNFFKNINTVSSYTYFVSSLVDILTKREYLFKQLLNYYQLNVNNFKTYNVNPYNVIILNWKSNLLQNSNIEKISIESFKNTSDIMKLNLYTTDLDYLYFKYFIKNYKNNFMQNYYLQECFKEINDIMVSIDFNQILNSLLDVLIFDNFKSNWNFDLKPFLIVNYDKLILNFNKLNKTYSLVLNNYNINTDKIFYKKTQYKHMRKSMANMIRIQNDKAVAMPVDTRIQFITVSKDIIHSWSIPSAGIKIDCIPGYSSHKVTIFFLTGIYWGQCMEICGRYHHWMPIVVYFMKRDLFLLWCMHFVSSNKNMLTKTVNNNTDINYLVAYPASSWKNELLS